jgi:hypothetical protein
MSWYKKDDLLVLAGALKISTEGNMKDLIAHLHNHPELNALPQIFSMWPGDEFCPESSNAAVSTSATAHQTSYPTVPNPGFKFVSQNNTAHTMFSIHQLPSPSMPNHFVVLHPYFPTDTHHTIHTLNLSHIDTLLNVLYFR